MDSHTYDNWVLIKKKMEESGNTSNHFYKRACEIVRTGKDPFSHILNHGKK
jgi:hypothetical protein